MTDRNFEVSKEDGAVPIKSWTKGVPFEDEARAQVQRLARMPFIHKHVAIMPDVHGGIGATVGSVIATKHAIIPAAVGVDIGCVDMDTEFLSPNGWVPISQYTGEQVMQYEPETGLARFILPSAYIKLPCESFLRLKTKYGVDQMLSDEHKVLYAKYDRSYSFSKLDTISAADLASKHDATVLGFRGRFLTTFTPQIDTRLDISDADLRVMVMIMADGHFDSRRKGDYCTLQFKKGRKISRALSLLTAAGIEHTRTGPSSEGVSGFTFYAPLRQKSMSWLWPASLAQLQLIAEEAIHWDGNADDHVFFTRDKPSADFMSYAFAACGYRSVMREDTHKDGEIDYRVFAHSGMNTKIGINGVPKTPIERVPSKDGQKYCFTVPSGFWVMRRGGVIAMTGNCGMMATRTSLFAKDLPDNLHALRSAIEAAVPHGRTDNGGANDRGAWNDVPLAVGCVWTGDLRDTYEDIRRLHPGAVHHRPAQQLGSLGTGNHFIEVCLDEEQRVWVMLHSGSRGAGNKIGQYFIELAKNEMKRWFINLPDQDLAYLPEGSDYFKDYLWAVEWAQNYALANRELMMKATLGALALHAPAFTSGEEAVQCHHNYVSTEHHFGENVLVTRKGAVRARKGDLGIIPGSMGAKSFIVRGKGNLESFQSCSHGAGRSMSRTEAKKRFTLDDHNAATAGVECRRDADVIDETPGAYKSIDAVMAAQSDLVEVVHTLKQVLVVKG